MFFDDWFAIVRVLTIGVVSYVTLIASLRLSGKRTLSKWNAFDFIVTIAFGSILATVVISKDVTLTEGILAHSLLVGLQFVITWTSVRSRWVEDLVKAKPSLVFHRGEFARETMLKERVSEAEVLAAIRSAGEAQIEKIEAVVLETDGSLSVIRKPQEGPTTSLKDVKTESID